MEIGIVGKPNVGKSTFFEAATLAGAEIANYPFTTIDANKGMGYLRAKCPHVELNVQCQPNNSTCLDGTRFVPVELLDVAGLVPDAHSGKGLGNKFLDDIRQAKMLIHVVDISGSTDAEGNPVDPGTHDPADDVVFLEKEMDYWMKGIIMKEWYKISRMAESQGKKLESLLYDKLTGLGINIHQIIESLHHLDFGEKYTKWTDDQLLELASDLRSRSKPLIIAANKADRVEEESIENLITSAGDYTVIPTCAEAELALRRADKAGMIRYRPGGGDFEMVDEGNLNSAQIKGLERIREVLDRFGSTNIQKTLETAAYDLLDLIVVYPVEDEHKFTDKDGRVLPDAHLVRSGSNAKDLAYKVHTDLGDNFIRAIDCKTNRTIGADHELKDGDVVKIHANA